MLIASRNRLARLQYGPNGFRVLAPGDHVLCAVTGAPIGLDELRYWSVARQEPYATAEISVKAALDAAREAGMRTVLLDRREDYPEPRTGDATNGHPRVESFAEIAP